MERADESLLPGVYKEVGATLHTDPTLLGSLTLFRSIVQTLCYPLAMYLAVRHNCTHVIALGAFLWVAATFLVGISSTFFQVVVSRGLNGILLATVIPAIQSLVVDSIENHNRGVAFGWLQLTGNIGSILGGMMSVLLASKSFMGVVGWRILSIIVGIFVRLYAKDPLFVEKNCLNVESSPAESLSLELKELFSRSKNLLASPTKKQPFFGVCTQFIGELFGGKMGDILSVHLPNSGRIILSQISAGSFIPLAWILMFGLPDDPSTAFKHGVVLFIIGLCTSWNAAATNSPIFAEIVPEKSRTSIYALDKSFTLFLTSYFIDS
ncbi:hypothetical protein C5167_011280 [Papaver somniferum]|uniref:Major facilitator superfamily (MFS) profile domain-containing protein n=1 Tax=Papaver somniferum TaxID=3469 RepID=A0A4Y7K6M5_PAPSO|nr:hypothetical protein C5167_011280 [Papaver somniferum]